MRICDICHQLLKIIMIPIFLVGMASTNEAMADGYIVKIRNIDDSENQIDNICYKNLSCKIVLNTIIDGEHLNISTVTTINESTADLIFYIDNTKLTANNNDIYYIILNNNGIWHGIVTLRMPPHEHGGFDSATNLHHPVIRKYSDSIARLEILIAENHQ